MTTSELILPGLYAALVWWFTTGTILVLDGLPRRTFGLSMLGATIVLLGACFGVCASAAVVSPIGAYAGFTAAILMWAWLELSFLTGFITGPRKQACPASCTGWRRFLHATQAILYNELATLACAGWVTAATWGAPNQTAFYTFIVLWTMRLSAKLNLFLGVPNLGEKFLPSHLAYLAGFFKRRAMNALFPLSMVVSLWALVVLSRRFAASVDAFDAASYGLTTSLLALAIIEHAFMVIPLPSERLWQWALKSR